MLTSKDIHLVLSSLIQNLKISKFYPYNFILHRFFNTWITIIQESQRIEFLQNENGSRKNPIKKHGKVPDYRLTYVTYIACQKKK